MDINQIFNNNILILIILTTIWCFFHSALISTGVVNFFKKILDANFRYYRIAYNLFSLITFVVVVLFEMKIRQEIIFHWNGIFRFFQVLLFIFVLLIFYFGSKKYSFSEFIGLNQMNKQEIYLTISHSGKLNTDGIHGLIRHPWYLGTLIIIWLRDWSVSIIAMNIVLSAYLIIGSYLEERKLINEFGQTYIDYKNKVSMLIPFKWIVKSKI